MSMSVRRGDIAAVVDGRSGTLGEGAVDCEEGHPIGVLTGAGGIAGARRDREASLRRETSREVMSDAAPARFVGRLLERYRPDADVCRCRPAGRPCAAR